MKVGIAGVCANAAPETAATIAMVVNQWSACIAYLRVALSDEFGALFLAVIAEELGRGGLALTLLPNVETPDVLPVRDVAMDGAIVYSCSPAEVSVEWLRRRRLPLVLVDQAPDDAFTSVNIDDRAGALAAAAHVVALGHRRIQLAIFLERRRKR